MVTDEVKRLREQYMVATEQQKKAMEKRYGRVVIRRIIEDSFTEEWLEEYSKKCPHCGTHIQVKFITITSDISFQRLNALCIIWWTGRWHKALLESHLIRKASLSFACRNCSLGQSQEIERFSCQAEAFTVSL